MKQWRIMAGFVAFLLAASVAFISTTTRDGDVAAAVSFDDAKLRMRIDIGERKLYIEEDGESIATYNVSVGTEQHPTPSGTFTVERLIWNPRRVPPNSEWAKDEKAREPGDPLNPMGRVKVFFRQPDYYIHGTNAVASIGTAASHGCVRMLNNDVIEVAQLLMDRGGAPVEPGLVRRSINRVRQTEEVRLTNPIPLQIED